MSVKNYETSMQQSETLIKELYNRSKSNMKLISDLINMKLAHSHDAAVKEVLADCETKIITMSRVHELIYESRNMSEINLREYVDDIFDILVRLKKIPGKKVRFSNRLEDFDVNINVAIPLGMIINELITNSVNCAFRNDACGNIVCKGECSGKKLFMEYQDDGVGLPDLFKLEDLQTYGLKLINDVISTQLLGSVDFENRDGFYCSMVIDLNIH